MNLKNFSQFLYSCFRCDLPWRQLKHFATYGSTAIFYFTNSNRLAVSQKGISLTMTTTFLPISSAGMNIVL